MATILIADDHVLNREFLIKLPDYGGHQLPKVVDGCEFVNPLREGVSANDAGRMP